MISWVLRAPRGLCTAGDQREVAACLAAMADCRATNATIASRVVVIAQAAKAANLQGLSVSQPGSRVRGEPRPGDELTSSGPRARSSRCDTPQRSQVNRSCS